MAVHYVTMLRPPQKYKTLRTACSRPAKSSDVLDNGPKLARKTSARWFAVPFLGARQHGGSCEPGADQGCRRATPAILTERPKTSVSLGQVAVLDPHGARDWGGFLKGLASSFWLEDHAARAIASEW